MGSEAETKLLEQGLKVTKAFLPSASSAGVRIYPAVGADVEVKVDEHVGGAVDHLIHVLMHHTHTETGTESEAVSVDFNKFTSGVAPDRKKTNTTLSSRQDWLDVKV